MKKYKIIKDKFRRARGGHSTVYAIMCSKCGDYLLTYQKDGTPHQWLKRLYEDRILITDKWVGGNCKSCGQQFAVPRLYEKENRNAFFLIKGTIKKKILYRE